MSGKSGMACTDVRRLFPVSALATALRQDGGMPEPVSDFRLYHSNSLEVLSGLLAAELARPVPGQSLLVPDVVLIPQVAMRRWLQATLAAQHGIAANLEFLTPGEFVARTLKANVPGDSEDLGADALHWRLYAALTDPLTLREPAMHALRAYLAGNDPLKPWSLAGELAGVFEKYQAWRRDWLLGWEAGQAPRDPQALLWRKVAGGSQHRARRIDEYLNGFAAPGSALPSGLPARLFAFATLNVSPDVLRVIATQARVGVLHFYMPTPTRSYWGDLQTLGERLRSGAEDPFDLAGNDGPGENRLLQAWGAAGRDFMAVLGSYEVVHPSGEIAAYDDPEQGEPGKSLADSLLTRLHADLFHRRATPAGALREALDRNDPSLQVHACHTPLREVQVLHDQLRDLLEDPRFDPPLQAREIAVLAPDIDPYAPYIDAVFGGRNGHHDFIPYALADTSPLAGEPLAEVFVRLLGLPVSRFGLNEILDLLASPALADAAGLDAASLERLHGWLQSAGARWGLDAAHRAQHQAPRDDAYTWAFALDRLLLGHASGSDGDIAGVAPWTALEGGALSALDALIRLLRHLARYQRVLGEAMPAAQWRERLLGLLEAVLPPDTQDLAGQRALDRLRKLIDDFASSAQRAAFDALVPAEVVRAHFATALAEADTRAPLLTGGISFGRMVPMRLLPFRVICVLGMNDGDYPRRDPAAGLNQLTAELGTNRRRHGDRSLREDDRFLFLQLFSTAQNVFYLSYLGADPRDGSVREPSVLVTELIDAAAQYHAQPAETAKALVVRHPLQPFAAAAFGEGDEPRRFSYRDEWRPAAASLGHVHHSLAPWVKSPLPEIASAEEESGSLTLDSLRRFLLDPSGQFLSQRLGLRLPDSDDGGDDVEPLQLEDALLKSQLQQAVLEAQLAGNTGNLYERMRARALLPSGALGQRELRELRATLRPYAAAYTAWAEGTEATSRLFAVEIDGVQLHGRVQGIHPHGIARLRPGKFSGNAAIRFGLDWLLANAAGANLPLVVLAGHDKDEDRANFRISEPVAQEKAKAALRMLLQMRTQGMSTPLPFAPYTGWTIYTADPARAESAALAKWYGNDFSDFAESASASIALAFRGRDPLATAEGYAEFAHNSHRIFEAVCCGNPLVAFGELLHA